MQKEDLIKYIQAELQKGTSETSIKAILNVNGWSDSDIDAAFTLLNNVKSSNVTPTDSEVKKELKNRFRKKWRSLFYSGCAFFTIPLAVILTLIYMDYVNSTSYGQEWSFNDSLFFILPGLIATAVGLFLASGIIAQTSHPFDVNMKESKLRIVFHIILTVLLTCVFGFVLYFPACMASLTLLSFFE